MVLKLKISGSERNVRTTGTKLIRIENRKTGLGRNSFYEKAAKAASRPILEKWTRNLCLGRNSKHCYKMKHQRD